MIINYDENRTITVTLTTGEKGTAKCSPDDKFSFDVGITLAVERAKNQKSLRDFKRSEPLKVGDRVKIRSWKEMEEEFGLNAGGGIAVKYGFYDEMKPLCGCYATITDINSTSVYLGYWSKKGLKTAYLFSKDMLEKVNKAKK